MFKLVYDDGKSDPLNCWELKKLIDSSLLPPCNNIEVNGTNVPWEIFKTIYNSNVCERCWHNWK